MCVCVCVSGYAFRHALRYRAESWHGGRGQAPEVWEHIFEATPSKVKGHPEVKLPYKCAMATKFGGKNPWPERCALLGSKVMQGSPGVNQGSHYLEMPCGHQIWWKEPLTRAQCIAGVKGHVGVSWGQVGVNLPSNALWPPILVGRIHDQSIMNCWCQRSCRGHPGVNQGSYYLETPYGHQIWWGESLTRA